MMGQNSSIEWTNHTFNLVWGCLRVSPGCEHCYAESLAKRWGYDIWGPAKTTARRTMSEKYWQQPLRWNAQAERAGQRARVFCSSMADVFEDHPTNNEERPKLWTVIEGTPWLDWLLLTKRPENIARMMPVRWGADPELGIFDDTSLMPSNVWIGTSCEDQQRAEERIPHLLSVPARVRFLSCEPLLGPVDLTKYLYLDWRSTEEKTKGGNTYKVARNMCRIDWVIVGGESGPGARPMHPDWARSLRDQCVEAGVAYHFKQHGAYIHESQIWRNPMTANGVINAEAHNSLMTGKKELADRGWQHEDRSISFHVGKHASGRLLDGQTWDQFPTVG